ncbi:hypothetical protein [Flavobacterium sp.]|uniref:hypothetical protein n=1 Tax=Flavobacterium sp. TaxID=239 RepID=UPI0026192687|nr:hypothetical protein [Flavobacterium sp.]
MLRFKFIVFILFGFFTTDFVYGQLKTVSDTLFYSGYKPSFEKSKITEILKGVSEHCESIHPKIADASLASNREFRTNSTLKLFDEKSDSTIFTSADAVIVCYFCQNLDYVDEIELYEFHFLNETAARTLVEKLEYLRLKSGFRDYIGYKNWFVRQTENVVYFIDYKKDDPKIALVSKLIENIEAVIVARN